MVSRVQELAEYYGRPMDLEQAARRPVRLVLVGAVVAAALGLALIPVQASYLSRVGSDTVEYRIASCGSPITSLLGAEPGLGGGSPRPIGLASAVTACEAASGKRAIITLVLLLGALVGYGLTRGRRVEASERPAETALV